MTLPPDAKSQADGAANRDRLVANLGAQSASAVGLGSPLYADLLSRAAADVAAEGACWAVLRPYAHQLDAMALPLRFMAAVHRVVLRRLAPALGVHYASVGGEAGIDGAWDAFQATVETHRDLLIGLTALPCQTNEVGRSAALGPAIAWLAGRHDLPVHHLEIGTSAGLNLRWDRFRYGTADGVVTWGSADSPVDLVGHWMVAPTGLPAAVDIASRQGCDPTPLDPADQGARETLTAAVWADMPARHERLKGALALAAEVPATIVARGAGEWLAEVLPERRNGLTVVSHSVVWRYIPEAERAGIMHTLSAVGGQATAANPLAWVRLEPRPPKMVYDGNPYPILVTQWPGGQTHSLGNAQAHGQSLRWHATPEPFPQPLTP